MQEVAPWLTTDSDPYPAVVDGRITWIVDGYTTLPNYPYAEEVAFGSAHHRRAERRPARAEPDHQLPAQLGEGHGRRLRRHGHPLRVRRLRPGAQDVDEGVPRHRAAQHGDQPEPALALPLPGGPVQGAARAADPLPRRQPGGVLRRRVVLGRARPTRRCSPARRGPRSRPTTCSRAARGRRRHAADVPAHQRAGVQEPRHPLVVRVGQLGPGDVREDHRAATAFGHADARPTAGAVAVPQLADGQLEHQPAFAAGRRRSITATC